ncbi:MULTISPECIES: hypothetical protein [Enterobacterales]|jgi:Ca2+-binding EF-hand superfamily protein|uniref:hypothetical protein n=1 Tax=Enterobacterales TaxID=91347 RepID=UPI0003BF9FB4|nr:MULTISPECIES: hypothetical protein [Enterobacteriaceae]EFA0779340.1 hypothetical protein [Escherichia coli]EFF9667484.1 hypothetical protein [Escherichia coli]EKJ3356015.1 hypothetical protein [Escherichia coli]ELS5398337.1 hypothetical protein [Escherichia coli]ESN47279.1 hypothetical protein L363_05120 [Klebsiella pneumoniae MGH 17]
MSEAYKELTDLIEKSFSLKELFQAINEAGGSAEIKANRFIRWLPGSLVERLDKKEVEALFEENPLR